jgi:hypothetical protein
MLQSLDTLIAFIVIMTIVSLFVTIIVQIVATTLSLRGKNLANALALTFQAIDAALTASAHQLAARILSNPLLSDSTRTDKDFHQHDSPIKTSPWSALTFRFDKAIRLATAIRSEEVYDALKKLAAGGEFKSPETVAAENKVSEKQKALSALDATADKTVASKELADAQASLAELKKKDDFDDNLAAAQSKVENALQNLAGVFKKSAEKELADAEAALNQYKNKDKIDSHELAAAEKKVETAHQKLASTQKKAAQAALAKAQKELYDFCNTRLSDFARKLLASLRAPADKDSAAADTLSAFSQLTSSIPSGLKDQFDKAMQDTSAQLVGIIDTERGKFERWFKSAQDRAQQWFQLHTRVATVCASICIAFLFQLDAVEVFHYVSTNSAARTALVTKADTVVQQADGIVNEKGGLVQRIADDWNKAEPDHQLANAGAIQNTGQLENELRKVAAAGPKPIEDFEARYNQIGNAAIKTYYDEKQKLLDQLGKEANATGFDLIPTAFWRWPVKGLPQGQGVASTCNGFLCHLGTFGPHLVGIALFAALLTLGAPYWYNLLKNLTSLRPALTQLIGGEKAAETKTEN